jgi:DNA-binding CsgD family transcriptional regulator
VSLTTVDRVTLRERMTDMEFLVAALVGLNMTGTQIAKELGIAVGTVRHHAKAAKRKIPGDLPAMARLAAWARGASIDVLEGRSLRYEIVQRQNGEVRSPPHSGDTANGGRA